MSITLTYEQEYIVNEAVKWFNDSSDMTFQIEGPAGTGKSVVLASIISRLGLKEEEILPMAYTGQAVSVMRMKGLRTAVTCHSALFVYLEIPLFDDFGKPVMDTVHNKQKTITRQFNRDVKADHPDLKLIIVDECYMIPESFRENIDNTGVKVIAAGDSSQLPPIEGPPAYLVYGKVYHLTQLMRQSAESAIVQVAMAAKNKEPLICGRYNNGELVIVDYPPTARTYGIADITLCGSNKTRTEINNSYRSECLHLSPDELPKPGEKMVCKMNRWNHTVDNISLTNGLVGIADNVQTTLECGCKSNLFKMDFITPLCTFPEIECDYNFLIADKPIRERIKNDKFKKWDGCKFDYGDACTVHSAQGSEYEKGIYVYEDIYNTDVKNAHLHYTAITRFRNRLVIILYYVRSKYY